MGFITSVGWFGINLANQCRPRKKWIDIRDTKAEKALYAADFLIGITGVVLGILALLKILPLPPSMIDPFAYGAIAAGGLNLLTTALIKTSLMLWESAQKTNLRKGS